MPQFVRFPPVVPLLAVLVLLAASGCSSVRDDAAVGGRAAAALQPVPGLAPEGVEPGPQLLFTARQPKHPARSLMVAGDSLSIGLGEKLERSLGGEAGIGFSRMGKVSSGLARPDFFDWEANMAVMAGRFRPDVVLVMLGANDNKHIRLSGGDQLLFATSEWDAAYAAKAQRLVDICRAANPRVTVFWVGAPVMADAALSRDIAHINTLLARVARTNKDCYFVDSWRLFADRAGRYAASKPDVQDGQPLRARDGVHLSHAGAQALADECLAAMNARIRWARLPDTAALETPDTLREPAHIGRPGQAGKDTA